MRGWDPEPYQRHRERLLVASIPSAALMGSCVSLAYNAIGVARTGVMDWLLATLIAVQVGMPLLAWGLVRGRLRGRGTWAAVLADAPFTASIVGRLFVVGGSTVSGVALFLSVKMLATSLFFPWGKRSQNASVGFALASYYAALAWSGHWPSFAAEGIHQLLGPVIAAILSITGAAGAERLRRALFERESEAQREARVTASLARVSEALLGCREESELVERLCRISTEVLDCDCSHTVLWQPGEEAFVFAGGYGYPPEQREALGVLKVRPAGLEAELAELKTRGVVQASLADLLDPGWRNLAAEMELTVGLGVALSRGEELIGFHCACFRGRTGRFGEPELRVARGIGRIATLALENVRLVERLADASKTKSEFVAAISHELRSPLSVILGYSDLLRSGSFGALNPEQAQCVGRLERSGRELHELITSTLDLSRIEAGTLQLDRREVSVEDVAAEIDDEIAELKEKDGLSFSWQLADDLPLLCTDPQKLKVVLKNLITNAIKFTEQGSVSVEVRRANDGVEFLVIDTGIGIAPEALSRIFEAFHQEGGLPRRRAGVGLGLYIVRRLLALLEGTIGVESQVGQGSIFTVRVPERTAVRRALAGDQPVAQQSA